MDEKKAKGVDSFGDILNLLEKNNLCVVPISFLQNLVNNVNGQKQCDSCQGNKAQQYYHKNVLSKLDELIEALKYNNCLKPPIVNRKPAGNIRTAKIRNRKRSVLPKTVNRKTSSSTDENNREIPTYHTTRNSTQKLSSVLKKRNRDKSNECRLVQRSVRFETSGEYYSEQLQSRNPFLTGNLRSNPFNSDIRKCVMRNPFIPNSNKNWSGFRNSNESGFRNSGFSLVRSDLSLYQYQANLESMQSRVSEWRKRIGEIDGQIETLITSSEELESSSGDEHASLKLIIF